MSRHHCCRTRLKRLRAGFLNFHVRHRRIVLNRGRISVYVQISARFRVKGVKTFGATSPDTLNLSVRSNLLSGARPNYLTSRARRFRKRLRSNFSTTVTLWFERALRRVTVSVFSFHLFGPVTVQPDERSRLLRIFIRFDLPWIR